MRQLLTAVSTNRAAILIVFIIIANRTANAAAMAVLPTHAATLLMATATLSRREVAEAINQ